MTREELLGKVNDIVDTTKFKSLSQQTIEEELDDALEDIGEDETLDDKGVEKLAKRLKRMDGNIHASVSAEMKKNRNRANTRNKNGEERKDDKNSEDDVDSDKISVLEAKLNELIAANESREKAAKKKVMLEKIRKGVAAKFNEAELEVNDFFMDVAMSKLEIPDTEEIDIDALVKKVEGIYTSDYKRATGQKAIPHKGGQVYGLEKNTGDHEFDDIVERRKRRFGEVHSDKK